MPQLGIKLQNMRGYEEGIRHKMIKDVVDGGRRRDILRKMWMGGQLGRCRMTKCYKGCTCKWV